MHNHSCCCYHRTFHRLYNLCFRIPLYKVVSELSGPGIGIPDSSFSVVSRPSQSSRSSLHRHTRNRRCCLHRRNCHPPSITCCHILAELLLVLCSWDPCICTPCSNFFQCLDHNNRRRHIDKRPGYFHRRIVRRPYKLGRHRLRSSSMAARTWDPSMRTSCSSSFLLYGHSNRRRPRHKF